MSSQSTPLPSDFVHYSNVRLTVVDAFPPSSLPHATAWPPLGPPFEPPSAPNGETPPALSSLAQRQTDGPRANADGMLEFILIVVFSCCCGCCVLCLYRRRRRRRKEAQVVRKKGAKETKPKVDVESHVYACSSNETTPTARPTLPRIISATSGNGSSAGGSFSSLDLRALQQRNEADGAAPASQNLAGATIKPTSNSRTLASTISSTDVLAPEAQHQRAQPPLSSLPESGECLPPAASAGQDSSRASTPRNVVPRTAYMSAPETMIVPATKDTRAFAAAPVTQPRNIGAFAGQGSSSMKLVRAQSDDETLGSCRSHRGSRSSSPTDTSVGTSARGLQAMHRLPYSIGAESFAEKVSESRSLQQAATGSGKRTHGAKEAPPSARPTCSSRSSQSTKPAAEPLRSAVREEDVFEVNAEKFARSLSDDEGVGSSRSLSRRSRSPMESERDSTTPRGRGLRMLPYSIGAESFDRRISAFRESQQGSTGQRSSKTQAGAKELPPSARSTHSTASSLSSLWAAVDKAAGKADEQGGSPGNENHAAASSSSHKLVRSLSEDDLVSNRSSRARGSPSLRSKSPMDADETSPRAKGPRVLSYSIGAESFARRATAYRESQQSRSERRQSARSDGTKEAPPSMRSNRSTLSAKSIQSLQSTLSSGGGHGNKDVATAQQTRQDTRALPPGTRSFSRSRSNSPVESGNVEMTPRGNRLRLVSPSGSLSADRPMSAKQRRSQRSHRGTATSRSNEGTKEAPPSLRSTSKRSSASSASKEAFVDERDSPLNA